MKIVGNINNKLKIARLFPGLSFLGHFRFAVHKRMRCLQIVVCQTEPDFLPKFRGQEHVPGSNL